MKGIIINEGSPLLENKYVNTCYIKYGDLSIQLSPDDGTLYSLSGVTDKSSSACCSKNDTYDFETGALIALMKMCGLEKSAKAYAEIFDDTAYGDALIERDKLKEKVDDLYAYNKGLIDEIDQKNHEIISLKTLKLTNESLKEENKRLSNEIEDLRSEKEYLEKEIKDVTDRIVIPTIKDLLYDVGTGILEGLIFGGDRRGSRRRSRRDRDSSSDGYTNFWKTGRKDRDHEVNTYSRRRIDLDEMINKLTVDSLIEEGRAFTRKCVDEWVYKIPTKREEMWEDILKEGRTPVYVKREDIHDFLKECQLMGIKWATGKMPLETMPFHMSEGYDGVYFFVATSLDISKSTSGSKEYRHVMCWWMTASEEEARNSIKYIRPMRWDLFKKGRLAVKVNYDNYKEFYEACKKALGKRPVTAVFTEDFTVSICKKDGLFEMFTIEDQKKTGKKIVNWEDVR